MSVNAHDTSSRTLDQFNDIDRETRFKIAQKEEEDSTTLLAFYRDRINAFVTEREEWLHKLDQTMAAKEEHNTQQLELQGKREEVADLQRSISEAKVSLHNEREQKLKLKRENDFLKLIEFENRKKIYELMVLNEPEKDDNFYKDLRPDVKKHMKNDLSMQLNKKNTVKFDDGGFGGSGKLGKTKKEVLKTIYLPNEQLNAIVYENDNLKRRVEEEKAAHAEQIATLEEEIRIREEEMFKRHEVDVDRIHELEEKNKYLEKLKSSLAKEYFTLRLQINERRQQLYAENDLLKVKYDGLKQKMENHDRKVDVENKIAQEMLEKKAIEYEGKFRGTLKQKDENLFMVKDQYAHVQKTYLNKLHAIEENLANLANKYQTLDHRRMIENEEFRSETKDLERRLRLFEKKYFRIDHSKTQTKDRVLGFKGVEELENEEIYREAQEDEHEEEQSSAASITSEEFSLIRQQLAELENKLDKTRKKEPFKY